MRFIGSWPRGEVEIGEDEGGKTTNGSSDIEIPGIAQPPTEFA